MNALIAAAFFQIVLSAPVQFGGSVTVSFTTYPFAIDGCSGAIVTAKWEGEDVTYKPLDLEAASHDVDGWCSITSQPEIETYSRP